MSAPLPSLIESKLNFFFEIEIISEKNVKYILSLKTENSSNLIISAYNIDEKLFPQIFSNNFSPERIKENKYFLQFDNLKEICEELSERIKTEKILLSEKNDKLLILSIPLHTSKIKEICFELFQKEKSEKDEMMEIINIQKIEINELKEKTSSLENIINQQKKNINKLEEKILVLENLSKNNKNEIDECKNQIKILSNTKNNLNNNENLIENFESEIIKDNVKYNISLKNWINPNKKIKAELLYRLTRDGNKISTFHEKCDNKGPTLTIFNLSEGYKVGIYTPLDWDSNSLWKNDINSFLFNLNKNQKYKKLRKDLSIYCDKICGPFSGNLGCNFGNEIKNLSHRNNIIYKNCYENDVEILPSNNQEKEYDIQELEIFKIIVY